MRKGRDEARGKIGTVVVAALTALALVGCATIESIFAPPPPKAPVPAPPPPAKKEPAVPLSPKKEPEAPPAKKEPEAPPAKKEPEAPPAKKEPPPPAKKEPPPPTKKEPAIPPTKKEPEAPPAKKEPEAPPAVREPEAQPPVLAPQVGKDDEEQLRREAGSRIQRTEQIIGQLEDKKLSQDQKEQLLTIQSLLGNAKEALATRDLTKAANLSEKTRILAEELARGIR